MSAGVDPRAVVADGAHLAGDVSVGPYAIIGERVKIGAGSVIGPHAVVAGDTMLGANTRVYPFASVGEHGPAGGSGGDEDMHSSAVLGDNNVVREGVTIHAGTKAGGITKIGDNNLFMAYAHVGHDCVIGSHNIFVNFATLAGHVRVGDWASLSCFVQVHQRCRIGSYSYNCASSIISMDVPPYVKVFGVPAAPVSVNHEGLKRRGFDAVRRRRLKRAFQILYRRNLTLEQAIARLDEEIDAADEPEQASDLGLLADFIRRSERGIIR